MTYAQASDKRLGTQPIALRALQRAGVVDPLATVGGALISNASPAMPGASPAMPGASPAIATSFREQLSASLSDHSPRLSTGAHPSSEGMRQPFSLPSDAYFSARASRQGGGLSRNNSNSNVADMAVSRPTQSDGAHTQCGRPESVIREAVALVTHGDAHDQAASSDAYALLSVAASAPPAPAPAQSIQSSSPAGGIQGGIHAGRLRAGGGDGTSVDEWSVSQELARLRAAAAGARAAAEAYEPRAGPYPAPRPYMPSLVNSHAERLQHPFPVSVMPRVETSSSRCASR